MQQITKTCISTNDLVYGIIAENNNKPLHAPS